MPASLQGRCAQALSSMTSCEAFVEPFQKIRIGVHCVWVSSSLKQQHRTTGARVDTNFVFSRARRDPQRGLANADMLTILGDPSSSVRRTKTVGGGGHHTGHCDIVIAIGMGNSLCAHHDQRSCGNSGADRSDGDRFGRAGGRHGGTTGNHRCADHGGRNAHRSACHCGGCLDDRRAGFNNCAAGRQGYSDDCGSEEGKLCVGKCHHAIMALLCQSPATQIYFANAALICTNAAGSSMVVKSPGSRPSASA